MHAFSHAEIHAGTHATRTAEAAAWRRAREAAPHLCPRPASALRNRVGEALIAAGIHLIQPAHLHARIARGTHGARPYGGLT
ncbi:hypothetical protein OTB20_26565 [Streptomyces sp. H27-H1]|uniref:hypothetical protein n=1 Tax=Streptomyces sp. H27-H1 TaxID=2996461 RepID=UPI0022701824|nr:hypothetical protein [Streptomyces sp. H27-H1]MCY0929691.1 hypothetical protein [Streptomyces sp. H27-H1]